MSVARVSWIVIVCASLLTAVFLAIGGYLGYSITAIAVGLAAAVNLLPGP